jgi:hypothetical protein
MSTGVCAAYYDLSVEGKPEEACRQIFKILRKAEDPALEFAIPSRMVEKSANRLGDNVDALVDVRIEIDMAGIYVYEFI